MRSYHIFIQTTEELPTENKRIYLTEKPHYLCTVKGSRELYNFCAKKFHNFRWNAQLNTEFYKHGETSLPRPTIVHIRYTDGTFVDYKTVTKKIHNYTMMRYYGKYSHCAYRYHYKCDIRTPRLNPCNEDIEEAALYGISLKIPKKQDRLVGWNDDCYKSVGKSWKDQTKKKHQYEKNTP